MTTSNEKCSNCLFFKSDTIAERSDRGLCRRFPPALVAKLDAEKDRIKPYAFYPFVYEHMWCGEHEEKTQ